MKVGLLLLDSLPESGTGGGGFTFKNEILEALIEFSSKSNHTFIVFHLNPKFTQKSSKNLQFVYLHQNFKKRLFYKTRQAINAILNKKRDLSKDFILQTIYENEIDILWYLTPFFCPIMEIPYITVVWDLQHRLQPYFPEVSTAGQWEWREQFFTIATKRATVVITGSETGKAEIECFYQVPKDNIKVLPLPTPYFAMRALVSEEDIKVKYNIQGEYLFYPAQFWSHKNHVGLLKAVRYLQEKYNLIFSVVFVGSDKGNSQYIKKVVTELNLTSQVYFLGFVPQQDLIALYRDAFALTFLSFFGPDNLPPLEAFALGCPVVAANVSGAEEQLGDAALLVDPRSPPQIAAAIASLHQDPVLYQTLIKRGLERACKWTRQDYVKGMFSILDELEPIRQCWSSKEPYRLNG